MPAQSGVVRPLPTVHEARSQDAFGERLVVEVPIKLSGKAASLIESSTGTTPTSPSLPHLRRFVKHAHLPAKFQTPKCDGARSESTIFLLLTNSSSLPVSAVTAALKPHISEQENLHEPFWARVPLAAPVTTEQATLWSKQYWPCVYNAASQTLQNAPPLQLLRITKAEIDNDHVFAYFRLARLSARACEDAQVGRASAAAVVDPVSAKVVAVAGDARWWPLNESDSRDPIKRSNEGRAEQHAVMRVIAQVANQELRYRNTEKARRSENEVDFVNPPGAAITALEKYYSDSFTNLQPPNFHPQDLPERQSSSRPRAYLCSGLDLYLTHEPCVSCSMAMLHSRFRVCVFEKLMPGTGGLQAEKLMGSLGYGLFWRRELNWRVMVFRFQKSVESQGEHDDQVVFHA